MNLLSSVTKQGRYITQVIHFIHGEKKTIFHIDSHSIIQGQFTKFKTRDGRLYMINDKNVLMIEVFGEKNERIKT